MSGTGNPSIERDPANEENERPGLDPEHEAETDPDAVAPNVIAPSIDSPTVPDIGPL